MIDYGGFGGFEVKFDLRYLDLSKYLVLRIGFISLYFVVCCN